MNVALLVTSLGWGGTERYVMDLALGLRAHGVYTRVIADQQPTDRLKLLQAAGVETIVLGEQYINSRHSYSRRLTDVLRTCRPDVVHINGWLRREWIVATLRRLRLPALCTENNTQRPIRFRDVIGLNRRPFSWYRQVFQALQFP